MQHFCRLYIHIFFLYILSLISLVVVSALNGFSAICLFKPNGLELLLNNLEMVFKDFLVPIIVLCVMPIVFIVLMVICYSFPVITNL